MNNETLADIVAEIRRHIQAARDYPQDIDITTGDVEDWTDRIEAAYARDIGNAAALREALLSVRKAIDYRGGDLARYTLPVIDAALKTPPEPAGNAAMMRMALEVLWDVIGQFSNNFLDGQTQLVLCDRLIPAKNAYHHALSSPPRNCERASGNAAAMREALAEQLRYWNTHVRTRDEEEMRVRTAAALSAPPRNCDRYRTLDEATTAWIECDDVDECGDPVEFDEWLFAKAEGDAK